MEYTRLGSSGLKVSRVALGCMSFGTGEDAHGWALDDAAAAPVFRQAVELGITFWDTANIYSLGTSEEVVGRAIKEYTRREDVVLATKVYFRMHDGPGGSGLSRKAIMEQVDASLRRLGTDYVDLYQIHRFDPDTPVEETMEALHDVVKAGKARYLGASSMWAWQFATMQHAADLDGWTRFVSMQNQYSLLQREEEREMFGLLADQGVGSIPWSPLAKGRLARPWGERTTRARDRRAARGGTTTRPTRRSWRPSSRSPRPAACPWRRSRWPGCCATRSSPPRSSGRPRSTTSPTPWPRSTWSSPTTRSRPSRRRTRRDCRRASPEVRREISADPGARRADCLLVGARRESPTAEQAPSPTTSDGHEHSHDGVSMLVGDGTRPRRSATGCVRSGCPRRSASPAR